MADLAVMFLQACGVSDLTTSIEKHAENIWQEVLGTSPALQQASQTRQAQVIAQTTQAHAENKLQPQLQAQPALRSDVPAAGVAASAVAPGVEQSEQKQVPATRVGVQQEQASALLRSRPVMTMSEAIEHAQLARKEASVIVQATGQPVTQATAIQQHVDRLSLLQPNQALVSVVASNLSLCRLSVVCLLMPRHLLESHKIAVREVRYAAEFQVEIECEYAVSDAAKQALHKWALATAIPGTLEIRVLPT
jgi:hypothetical protein